MEKKKLSQVKDVKIKLTKCQILNNKNNNKKTKPQNNENKLKCS